jgi:hypothetical protein
MQGHWPYVYKLMRGRLLALLGVGLSAICAACLIPGASASAASGSASDLRHTFAQTLISLRSTGNAAVCSSAIPQGKVALTEILRGEEKYLPSTTCTEAFVGRVAEEEQHTSLCGGLPHLSALRPVIEKALIHVRGNRGTVRLVSDFFCEHGENQVTGASAVRIDPMGVSHWLRRRGRWLFDDRPTGTYSPAGRKAVAMLRAAMSGRAVTDPAVLPESALTVPFCTNGTTQPVVTLTGSPALVMRPVFWYVAAGLTTTGLPEPPFDAQGDPQGSILVTDALSAEWNVKLVGGALMVTKPPGGVSLTVGAPGSAGC